jgi:hypothetical protein
VRVLVRSAPRIYSPRHACTETAARDDVPSTHSRHFASASTPRSPPILLHLRSTSVLRNSQPHALCYRSPDATAAAALWNSASLLTRLHRLAVGGNCPGATRRTRAPRAPRCPLKHAASPRRGRGRMRAWRFDRRGPARTLPRTRARARRPARAHSGRPASARAPTLRE